VDKRGEDDCWPWLGCKLKEGYGRWRYAGKFITAHRFSFLLHFGTLPARLLVCHSCDNPPCCNPNHFFLGTKKDNADDRDAKGRNVNLRGEQNGQAVLTEAQVLAIRSSYTPGRYKAGHVTHRALAKTYGVSRAAITHVLSGRNWGTL